MYMFGSWRWIALAVAFGLVAPASRAGMITPDSIPNPPSAVGSANGTSVYSNNIVNTQYGGLGLNFSSEAAITNLNGVAVWAPLASDIAIPASQISGSPPLAGQIGYSGSLVGTFVSLGSLNPATVSSLSVEVVGNIGQPPITKINVYGLNGQALNITPLIGLIGNVQDWTFTGSSIHSFSVSGTPSSPAWGVDQISFTPVQATTPEPSSFILAGLGALGLATRFRWRRTRTVA